MARKEIKMVGKNGQISIGKEFAGQLVMIEETSPNVFTLSLGEFCSYSETKYAQLLSEGLEEFKLGKTKKIDPLKPLDEQLADNKPKCTNSGLQKNSE